MKIKNMKEEVTKDTENLRKIIKSKQHNGRLLQQTRTSGNQNFRT
jgi:hypothetical protein